MFSNHTLGEASRYSRLSPIEAMVIVKLAAVRACYLMQHGDFHISGLLKNGMCVAQGLVI